MKHVCSLCILMTSLAWIPCSAQTFSVDLLEDSSGVEAPELSGAILGGCMDFLFNYGMIATNDSVARVDYSAFQSPGFGIAAAREGYVEYLAILWISYIGTGIDPVKPAPQKIQWRLMRVRDGFILGKGESKPPVLQKGTDEERGRVVAKFGETLAGLWVKMIVKERG